MARKYGFIDPDVCYSVILKAVKCNTAHDLIGKIENDVRQVEIILKGPRAHSVMHYVTVLVAYQSC